MISVNQGIGTSVPKRVEKRGTDDVTYQGSPLNGGGVALEILKGGWHHEGSQDMQIHCIV